MYRTVQIFLLKFNMNRNVFSNYRAENFILKKRKRKIDFVEIHLKISRVSILIHYNCNMEQVTSRKSQINQMQKNLPFERNRHSFVNGDGIFGPTL